MTPAGRRPEPGAPTASTFYRPAHTIDLRFLTLGYDTVLSRNGVRWWSTVTPLGVGTAAVRHTAGGVRADAWGPGAEWLIDGLPALLGADDHTADDFRPTHPKVRAMLDRVDSVRIGATHRWYDALLAAAIGQRVVAADAARSRIRLRQRHGPAAGPDLEPAFPAPTDLLNLADHDFHRLGVERSRARVLRVAARYADRVEGLDTGSGADARSWLQRLPGVGPWTAALTASVAGGDPDSVPVGDLHIPARVSWVLTGDEGDDERMLEALEPFAGHRQRVVRLIKATGAGPPAHRPRPFRADVAGI